MKKLAALAGLFALLAVTPANAYYYFVHYLSTGNAPEKFDLTALPDSSVTFLVSESGPTTYSLTDTFNSVLARLQQAAQIWNGVGSSSLRVAFGGLENPGTPQNTAGGDILFEDLPPGVEGFGGPTSRATNPVKAADGSYFFPIIRSVVHLSLNLTVAPGPSYGQSFLMTTLHEMGHALGLQHTFTSATMSQNTTRATTLTHPLSSDDVAGLSALYPNGNLQQFGTISGQITAGGKGIHLASVVAIAPGLDAVSAVTNRDGTYVIQGVPPATYAVYVHTMPPDADVLGPYDANGNTVAASGPVNSLFFPATTVFSSAGSVVVNAGAGVGGVNISTTSRANVPYYDGQVYGYVNNNTVPVTPGPVPISTTPTPVVASVVGLGSNGFVPGLGVQIPGGAVSIVPNGIVPILFGGYTYVDLYLAFSAAAQPGPEHLIFSTPDYMYVLPSAIYLTPAGPPSVTSVAANVDGTATVTGTNLSATSLIYFDTLPAPVLSLDPVAGTAIVVPPPGASGQQATVTIFNTDGQNSQMLQNPAVTWTYNAAVAPTISISPVALPAGSEAMIDITTTGFSFVQGQTTVGFGTSDVLVQRVFVLSPNHVQVDVAVAANAAHGISDITVMSGFQFATLPGGFQITAPAANLPEPFPVLINALSATGITGAYPGATVSLYGTNLGITGANTSVNLGGVLVLVTYSSATQVNLQIPAGLTPGPTILVLNNGLLTSLPIVVNLDPPPAGFSAVQAANGAYIDSSQSAYLGETLIATMNNFAPAGSNIALSQIQVSLGGVVHPALNITPVGSVWQITFQIGQNDPVGKDTLIVYLNGLSSLPAIIPVAAASSVTSQ